MKRKKPDEANGWTFVAFGGQTTVNGKPHWPDCLTFFIPRYHAYDVLASLAIQLQDKDYDEVAISWCGSMEPHQVNYLADLDALRKKHGFRFTHNPGGGEFYHDDLRCQIGMQDDREDYERFVAWLKENNIEP